GQVSKYRSRVHEAEAAAASSRERAAAAEREAAARRLESEAAETRASRLTSHLQTSADAASKAADNLHRSGPHTPAVAEAIAVLDALRQGVADASGSDRGQSSERWGPGSRRVRSANAPGQAPRAKRRRDRSASASVYDGSEDALAGQPGAANRQPAGKRALSSSSESCHAIAHYRRWQPARSQWFRAGERPLPEVPALQAAGNVRHVSSMARGDIARDGRRLQSSARKALPARIEARGQTRECLHHHHRIAKASVTRGCRSGSGGHEAVIPERSLRAKGAANKTAAWAEVALTFAVGGTCN
ncbi:unnamed protein product, partial [Symbiodinium sp. KB8]